jgi:hypothetical protein
VILSVVAILSRGGSVAMSSGDGGGSCYASCVRCGVLGRVFRFNHKIMINVQKTSPSIMVARNLWSARV